MTIARQWQYPELTTGFHITNTSQKLHNHVLLSVSVQTMVGLYQPARLVIVQIVGLTLHSSKARGLVAVVSIVKLRTPFLYRTKTYSQTYTHLNKLLCVHAQ